MSGNPDRFGDDEQRIAVDGDAVVPTDDDLSIKELQANVGAIRDEVGKRIIGQHDVVGRLFVCVLCDGNALLESNLGLGKTMLVRALLDATDLGFSRVQNTPDLMLSDITGTEIICETPEGRDFVFERGPIFANVVLADEMDHAIPKMQAVLLEAMQEKQMTAASETYEFPDSFFVLATQNPIGQGDTYPLLEVRTDRFLMGTLVDYPEFDEGRTVIKQYAEGGESPEIERVLPRTHLLTAQQPVRQVPVSDDTRNRTIELVRSTRKDEQVEFGASPRASMALVLVAKARAFVHGRTHVLWEDVAEIAPPVIRHRIILDLWAEREGLDPDDVIQRLLNEWLSDDRPRLPR